MSFRSIRIASMSLLVALGLGASGCVSADPTPAQTKKPYPLTTCVVSGEGLESMGKPVVIEYEGREVRLCCAGCEADFRKDPKSAMKKLDDAAKSQATQPAKADGHKH